MIVVVLGFPAALVLFLLLMERLEVTLFPAWQARPEPVGRPEPAPAPAPSGAGPRDEGH